MPSAARFLPKLEETLNRALLAGETLLWTGQPSQRAFVGDNYVGLVPASLVFGGVGIGFTLIPLAILSDSVPINPERILYAILFLLAGQFLLWGRCVVDYWLRQRTLYAVTTRRVICIQCRVGMSIVFETISRLECIEGDWSLRQVGSIYFVKPWASRFYQRSTGVVPAFLANEPEFCAIEDVADVVKIINDQRSSA